MVPTSFKIALAALLLAGTAAQAQQPPSQQAAATKTTLLADADKLTTVVLNLLDNALRPAPPCT